MSFFTALYNLLIGPLELFFEVLFSVVNRVIGHPGLSIIFLSLAMNFLVLPLYKMSDAMQAEEAATEAKLKPTVTHIKKTFKGDERFMILQTYYRENHYKPTDALKGSVSLLLEIPFFMAAYNFLSNLSILHGASFGPIANLAAPDAMLVLGGITINVLPILMTAINLISSAIYTKGASTRSKVQLYVMAALFLVLLYDSPAGLVFYWTLNNLFSLVKNVFMKLKNPKKVFCGLCSAIGVAALIFVVATHPMPTARSQFLLCCLTLMLQLPLVIYFIAKRFHHTADAVLAQKDSKTFWICGLFLTVLTGMFIPSGVISASPEEFLNAVTHTSPLIYILNATLTAAGFFLIWFGMFYLLAKDSGKKRMEYGMSVLCIAAVTDFMFFGRDYGNMAANLVFDVAPVYKNMLTNLALLLLLTGLLYFIWLKRTAALRFIFITATLAAVVISTVNLVSIQGTVSDKSEQLSQTPQKAPVIPLSKEGKNIIVLMLDRGIGPYVPYIMNEKPALKEQFDGFTYYSNTISHGGCTNFGAPGLFGGYEYTPEEMNKRDTLPLEEKHNEALKVMPVSFLNEGYTVSVFDPPCAGYDWIPDLSIYQDYPEIHVSNSMHAHDNGSEAMEEAAFAEQKQSRNLFCYSIFKVAPVCLQQYIYDQGRYHDLSTKNGQVCDSISLANGLMPSFIRAYSVLENLQDITNIQPGSQNTFLMMTNDTTHEPCILSEPSYTPAEEINNTQYDQSHANRFILGSSSIQVETVKQMTHYHVNMAAFLRIGDWFDYLRENEVYDNTRIVIVSDHGWNLGQQGLIQTSDVPMDKTSYQPVLMVKDFGATGFRENTEFMTNADTVSLVMADVIDSPVNPFTGKPLNNQAKYDHPQHLIGTAGWDVHTNNGTVFLPDHWVSVHDNILDPNNWEYLGKH